MKFITFDTDQKALIRQGIEERIQTNDVHNQNRDFNKQTQKISDKYLARYYSVKRKMDQNNSLTLTEGEKVCICSCVNPIYQLLLEKKPSINSQLLTNISTEERALLIQLDCCKDILVKCGFFNRREMLGNIDIHFRYIHILDTIDKMKASELIFLSQTSPETFYKIGFVFNQKEYLTVEMGQNINLLKCKFIPLKTSSIEAFGKEGFSSVTTKAKAYSLLLNASYPGKEKLNFILSLLQPNSFSAS